ncbi:MAG: FtsQ-type POTRA domain-containing protein [Alphaproteobacteria bacterium]|nr:FtsQ-type POTRA domain-containing protein [Alphaproteobacteria bacterium]
MSSVKLKRHPINKRKKTQRSLFQKLGVRRLPPFVVILGLCVLLLWGSFHNNALTSNLSTLFDTTMAHIGFRLEDVVVEGRMRTNKEQILTKLELKRGIPLLSINLFDAKEKLESLSWVKAARVERRFPDTLLIRISEKEPIAIWQNQNKTYLVDYDGELVETKEANKYKELPLVTGHKAPEHVGQLITLLEKFPAIKARVTAAMHLRSMRWDIRLDEKVDIRLPEKNAESALEYLLVLENRHHLMDREIMTVDMRIPGQLILRLTPAAMQRKVTLGKDV